MEQKLLRLEKLIGYLIFTGKIPIHSIQSELASKIEANKVSISRALSGEKKYLTDNFIERLNSEFGEQFNLEWLLSGEGEMLKTNNQISENNSGTGIIGNNVNGGGINDNKIILEMVEILKKKDEQIDKLLQIIQKDK
jgi:hypothetical protein